MGTNQPQKRQLMEQSVIVLGNAAELVAHVIRNVVGNDVSDTLNGSRVTASTIRTLAQSRFRRALVKAK